MKKVFITGATGFIGGYVADEFIRRGWKVTALVHKSASQKIDKLALSGNLEIAKADAADYDSLRDGIESSGKNVEAIVHCAGRASDVGRRKEFRRANLDSVRNAAGLARDMGIGRLVFISTTDVYGLRDFEGEAEDDLTLRAYPRNPYPEYKIQAENFIRSALSPERYSILRPAQVWGVGDTTLTPRIIDFLRWSPWIVHFGKWRGTNRWPHAHVRNVAMAVYLAVISEGAAGKAINVFDTETTSIDEFYRMIADAYLPGKQFRSIKLPFAAGYVFGSFVSAVSTALNLKRPFIDPSLYALCSVSRNLDFSNARMRSLFKEEGIPVITLEEGQRELSLSATEQQHE